MFHQLYAIWMSLSSSPTQHPRGRGFGLEVSWGGGCRVSIKSRVAPHGVMVWFILNMRAGSMYVLSWSPTRATPNVYIQVWLTLSKDKLTRIESSVLYVKPRVRLSRAWDNDYSLKLGCDCAISCMSQWRVEGVKKRGRKTSRPIHNTPRFGIWEGSTWCTAKLALGGLSIDNQLTSWTNLPIWK